MVFTAEDVHSSEGLQVSTTLVLVTWEDSQTILQEVIAEQVTSAAKAAETQGHGRLACPGTETTVWLRCYRRMQPLNLSCMHAGMVLALTPMWVLLERCMGGTASCMMILLVWCNL